MSDAEEPPASGQPGALIEAYKFLLVSQYQLWSAFAKGLFFVLSVEGVLIKVHEDCAGAGADIAIVGVGVALLGLLACWWGRENRRGVEELLRSVSTKLGEPMPVQPYLLMV